MGAARRLLVVVVRASVAMVDVLGVVVVRAVKEGPSAGCADCGAMVWGEVLILELIVAAV